MGLASDPRLPLLPGLMEVSVWMTCWIVRPPELGIVRWSPLIKPLLMLDSRPRGLPMANTSAAGRRRQGRWRAPGKYWGRAYGTCAGRRYVARVGVKAHDAEIKIDEPFFVRERTSTLKSQLSKH